MPLSTVCKSFTLKEGKGSDLWNFLGKRLTHVSSPIKTTLLPFKKGEKNAMINKDSIKKSYTLRILMHD